MAMRAFLNSLITMGFLCIATVFASMAAAQVDILRGPLSDEIGDREVAFLARDLETGIEYVLTGSDLNTRHAPWSTFKIPNLLIALETGVAASLDHAYPWDQDRRPAAGYWRETGARIKPCAAHFGTQLFGSFKTLPWMSEFANTANGLANGDMATPVFQMAPTAFGWADRSWCP